MQIILITTPYDPLSNGWVELARASGLTFTEELNAFADHGNDRQRTFELSPSQVPCVLGVRDDGSKVERGPYNGSANLADFMDEMANPPAAED